MKRLILIASLCAAGQAGASGDYSAPYTRYKAYSAPDIAVERFQKGELGVLQPGMKRVYLYTAWRAMTLGAGIKGAPGLPGGLGRADGSSFGDGWMSPGADGPGIDAWQRESGMPQSDFGACPSSSNTLAVATISAINKRKDATPARRKAWIDAQLMLSTICKSVEEARYRDEDALKDVQAPSPLPSGEPAIWRQLRDYQRAAALFHAERYPEATALFTQIAASNDHPMRDLGAYLALRSEVRFAVKQGVKADPAQRQDAWAALERRGQAIFANASLAARHEAARATLRSARVRLTPHAVFADLNKFLADVAADPFVDDRLGDWAVVMRLTDEYENVLGADIEAARVKYDFVDWIENQRECGYPRDDEHRDCRLPGQHAMEQWQRTGSRPWLAAALMMAETLPAPLEKAAAAVKPGEPAYLTIRFHLARLYRLAGRIKEARTVSDAALKLDLPDGSRNLFLEERFAVATSVRDAAAYMMRVDVDKSRGSDAPVRGLNADALLWLQRGLGAAGMVELAGVDTLDAAIRARLASSAWLRADLLGKHDVALRALAVLEPLAPLMKKEIAAYRNTQSPAERRHQMLLAALRFDLSAHVYEVSPSIAPVDQEEARASGWCSFKAYAITADEPKPFPWLLPPMPALEGRSVANAEMNALAPLKTATGFIGDHVLGRVKTNAADPDLPWLLHVVVASTRGGCLDANAKQLSREAFNVLHKRFPRDAWAKKTPYFY